MLFDGRLIDLVTQRRVELERRLQADSLTSDERKQRQLQQLGKKESTFLRLKRTKLGLNDFRTVKVIGKGAFGEVTNHVLSQEQSRTLFDRMLTGTACAKDGYWEDLRYEDPQEGGDVEKGSGAVLAPTFLRRGIDEGTTACPRTCGA